MVGGAATSCNSYSILLSNDPKPADNTGFGPVMISSQESLAPGVYNIHIASKFKKKLSIVLLIVFDKISDIIRIQCLQLLKNMVVTRLKPCNNMEWSGES